MTDVEQVVVRALARADAVRLPIRNWEGKNSANRTIAFRSLAEHGVPLRVGGDEVTRKSGERTLKDAQTAGLVVLSTFKRSKFHFVRVTERAALMARALTGVPGIGGGLWVLHEVAKRSQRKPKTLEELWVDEIELNDGKGWGDATKEERAALSETEMNALPAMAAGWIVADSTCYGHVRYAVAQPGWQEVDEPSEDLAVGDMPECDPEAEQLYESEVNACLAEMKSNKPDPPGEVGWLPLVLAHKECSIGPHEQDDHPGFRLALRAAKVRLADLRGRKGE